MYNKNHSNTILIVEDSPTQSINLKAMLESAGYTCLLASNGQTGLYLAQALLPRAIVLDFEMPHLNGFQVCEKLKEDEKTACIPVILMTRFNESDYISKSMELGVTRFIPKDPFANAVLLETLKQTIGENSTGSVS
jgi:CheY-like chemotaxis protein